MVKGSQGTAHIQVTYGNYGMVTCAGDMSGNGLHDWWSDLRKISKLL